MDFPLLPKLASLRQLDIQLIVEGDDLVVDSVTPISEELRTLLKANKESLLARIKAFTSRPCTSCGSYDYAFREDGRLICPCYFQKLEENQKPRPAFTSASQSEASRGLPDHCCQCKEKPAYFGAGCTP